jgi:RNA polymerase sigma-54 factor
MKIRISPNQIQKQILAPSMQQSIEVLILPITELSAAIENELQENPMMEIDEKKTNEADNQLDDVITRNLLLLKDKPREENYEVNGDDDDDQDSLRPLSRGVSLEDHLLQQLRLEVTDPIKLQIGEMIVGNLDQNGYFHGNCQEIAKTLNIENIEFVEDVLKTIQHFDPLGIAACTLQECLLAQVEARFNGHGRLLTELIKNHLDELARKKFVDIARKLKTPVDTIKEAAKTITLLEPKPARKFWTGETTVYTKPDIKVWKDESDQYQIQINHQNIPHLRISPYYQNMLRQPNRTQEELDFIREKIKNALLFIKSIEQRHQTISQIAKYIVDRQKDFFEQGHMFLKPLILKDIAEAINRNESTISRAISNKHIETPQGYFPMKFFFSQAIQEEDGTRNTSGVASRGLKEEIKELIEEENKNQPLSDQDIQDHFERKNMKIARRTISKYRSKLQILPSHLRKS